VTAEFTVDQVVDARNQMCPMPVLATAKAMRKLRPGQVLQVLTTDKGALSDIPAWAGDTGNELLATTTEDGVTVFHIRRSPEEA
jgi:TusA-related sulfurtransferase